MLEDKTYMSWGISSVQYNLRVCLLSSNCDITSSQLEKTVVIGVTYNDPDMSW